MGKTGIPVKPMTYKEAEMITREYEETRLYLTSIIQNHIPNSERNILSCSDLMYLKHCGRVILNVAKKMLRTRVRKGTEKAILENIASLSTSTDFSQRELLKDRISIQLEGCKVPDNHYLVRRYEKVCNN